MFFGSPEHLTFLRYEVLSPQRRYAVHGYWVFILYFSYSVGKTRPRPDCLCIHFHSTHKILPTQREHSSSQLKCGSSYIQWRPNKEETRFMSEISHYHARFNQIICFIIKGIFSSFIWYQTHDDISMYDWKKRIKLMHVKIDLRRIMVLSWYDKVRLAYPCQNKKSKQKEHDKETKEMLMMSFQHVLYSETWQTPLALNSYSAQINFDIII